MNPDNVLYTSMIAVQNEGSSSTVICATASNGAEHTITNCSLVSNLPDILGTSKIAVQNDASNSALKLIT